ncbi:Zinc finger protein 90 [Amphibalanus amphitrite]|uniref:Protein krueppel n=1 Tax=Amphibalanus amphitrite TaxID=1232801 RepID=A0A6A4UY26_AMPAM|nr:Zinc finger protein 90 [Amphibalanus amphitrite]
MDALVPNRSPVARVAGPPPPPVPLVEELHSYSCRICGKTFKLKGAVVVHMRVHSLERKHSCNYCDMKFKDTNSLRQHIRRHTGERPYQCSYCDKAFKQQSGLMQHERLHTAPVSIVRTGRKRMSQTLVEDLALLPPREQIRSRGRPRKEEERGDAGGGSEDDAG